MVARVEKVSTAFWMLLSWPLLTVSETVVSSTYFHRSDPGMSRSLIIIANSHGPSLVPCGTPAGTAPHSEKQSELSFTLCLLDLTCLNLLDLTRLALTLSDRGALCTP